MLLCGSEVSLCKQLHDNFAACQAALIAGFLVSAIAYPPGFCLDAWRQGRWPAPDGGADRS